MKVEKLANNGEKGQNCSYSGRIKSETRRAIVRDHACVTRRIRDSERKTRVVFSAALLHFHPSRRSSLVAHGERRAHHFFAPPLRSPPKTSQTAGLASPPPPSAAEEAVDRRGGGRFAFAAVFFPAAPPFSLAAANGAPRSTSWRSSTSSAKLPMLCERCSVEGAFARTERGGVPKP